jgi:endonuclease/exonuclease/phosphatase family metal-dependent hydrolase
MFPPLAGRASVQAHPWPVSLQFRVWGRGRVPGYDATVRIVSLNAWGGAMYDAFAEWLPSCGADVLCLQEVTCTAGLGGRTWFDDGERALPQQADLFQDVRTMLPGHNGLFVASDTGPIRDSAGKRHLQDFGLATFVRSRYPIVGVTSAFVHRGFEQHVGWPTTDRPRNALAIRVLDRSAGRFVVVANLHGLGDSDGKGDTPARAAQAERLADLVKSIGEPGDLVVVCGDLNVLPDSCTFATLAAIGLVDLVGTADTRTSGYTKPVRHANYMLVSDRQAVRRLAIPAEPEVSDHRPLILDL